MKEETNSDRYIITQLDFQLGFVFLDCLAKENQFIV